MSAGLERLISKAASEVRYHEYYDEFLAASADVNVRSSWARQNNLNPDLVSKRLLLETDENVLMLLLQKTTNKSDIEPLLSSKKYEEAFVLAARLNFSDSEILNILQATKNKSSSRFKKLRFLRFEDRFFFKKRPESLLFLLKNAGKDNITAFISDATTQEHVDEITRKLKSFQPDTDASKDVITFLRNMPWGLESTSLKKYYEATKDETCKKFLNEIFDKKEKVSNIFHYHVLETLVKDEEQIKTLSFAEVSDLQKHYSKSKSSFTTSNKELSDRTLWLLHKEVLKIWWDANKANLTDEDLKNLMVYYFEGNGWQDIQYQYVNAIFPEIFKFVKSEKLLTLITGNKGELESRVMRSDASLETAKLLPAQKVVSGHPDPGLILKELAESSNKDLELIETLLPTFTGTFGDFLIMLNSFKND